MRVKGGGRGKRNALSDLPSTADVAAVSAYFGSGPIADMQHGYSITSSASASNLICYF
jgi:hypothetical protein